MSDEVILKVGGLRYEGWVSVEIKKSVRALAGMFILKITDSWSKDKKGWFIVPGDFCELFIGSEKIITGYIDDIDYSVSSTSREITVSGRDKTADLVDCSIVSKKTVWNNIRLLGLIREFCAPFNISVTNSSGINTVISEFKYSPGDSIHDALDELSKKYGFMPSANENGDLDLAQIGQFRSHDNIIEGQNLLSSSIRIDHKERFSEYVLRSEDKATEENSGLFQIAKANDSGVKRYRPKVIQSPSESHSGDLSKRAEWELNLRESSSTAGSVVLRGWRQSNGDLWKQNYLVNFISTYLGMNVEFLIGDITYSIGSEGRLTKLELLRKDAFLSEFNLSRLNLDEESPEDQLKKDFWKL